MAPEHPTSVDNPPVTPLTDPEAPDFLESKRVTAILFHDPDDSASMKTLERVTSVAASLGDALAMGVLDLRAHAGVAAALDVRAAPTIVVFREGREADRLMGMAPPDVIRDTLQATITRR